MRYANQRIPFVDDQEDMHRMLTDDGESAAGRRS